MSWRCCGNRSRRVSYTYNLISRASSTSPPWPPWPRGVRRPTLDQYRASLRNGHLADVPLHRLLVAPVRLEDGGVLRVGVYTVTSLCTPAQWPNPLHIRTGCRDISRRRLWGCLRLHSRVTPCVLLPSRRVPPVAHRWSPRTVLGIDLASNSRSRSGIVSRIGTDIPYPQRVVPDHVSETVIRRGRTTMSRLLRLLMLLLLAAAPCAVAAEVRPGDQVRLIERDQHIPAHPGPGDTPRPSPLRQWLRGHGPAGQCGHGLDRGAWRAPAGRREHRLDYAPLPGRPTQWWGTRTGHVGLVSAQRLARAASEWPATARHLESGESPCPGRPVDLYGGRTRP